MDNEKRRGLVLSRLITSSWLLLVYQFSNEVVMVISARYYNKHSLNPSVLTQ